MKLWVIKIGTSLLRGNKILSTAEIIQTYCSFIASSKKNGNKIILVSSGAVGLGCSQLGINKRPEDISSLQAVAAVGQGYLMSLYEKSMKNYGYNVAQILLTRSELGSRISYKNASMTLTKLLEWDVLPVVNENDTISDEELRYGDNDTLSALVASAVSADELILLTDIDRLYSSDPKTDRSAKPITDIHHPNQLKEIEHHAIKNSDWGTGGINTKLTAARIATKSGIKVQLADGRNPEILNQILIGNRGGTIFHPQENPIGNKKSWLAYAIKPLGNLQIDEGACMALEKKGASLLLIGIKGVEGNFTSNQPVKIINNSGKEIARGICSLSSEQINKELERTKESESSPVVVHRDALVLTKNLID